MHASGFATNTGAGSTGYSGGSLAPAAQLPGRYFTQCPLPRDVLRWCVQVNAMTADSHARVAAAAAAAARASAAVAAAAGAAAGANGSSPLLLARCRSTQQQHGQQPVSPSLTVIPQPSEPQHPYQQQQEQEKEASPRAASKRPRLHLHALPGTQAAAAAVAPAAAAGAASDDPAPAAAAAGSAAAPVPAPAPAPVAAAAAAGTAPAPVAGPPASTAAAPAGAPPLGPPPPSHVLLPGEAWGAGGRWIEPWDEQAALATIHTLQHHWGGWKERQGRSAARQLQQKQQQRQRKAGSSTTDDDDHDEGGAESEGSDVGSADDEDINGGLGPTGPTPGTDQAGASGSGCVSAGGGDIAPAAPGSSSSSRAAGGLSPSRSRAAGAGASAASGHASGARSSPLASARPVAAPVATDAVAASAAGTAAAAAACGHIACGAAPGGTCLVAVIRSAEEVMYPAGTSGGGSGGAGSGRAASGGDASFFKRRALQRAAALLCALQQPLRTCADVDCLLAGVRGVGARTVDKLKEALARGGIRRAEAAAGCEREAVLRLFAGVWGAGRSSAEEWYGRGCRTLEDVARLPSLTHSQRLGLRYFHDFNARIPRDEVAEAEVLLRSALAHVLGQLIGWAPEDLVPACQRPRTPQTQTAQAPAQPLMPQPQTAPAQASPQAFLATPRGPLHATPRGPLHARVMGSYLRACKRECGDIDFLVALPQLRIRRRQQRRQGQQQQQGQWQQQQDHGDGCDGCDPRNRNEGQGEQGEEAVEAAVELVEVPPVVLLRRLVSHLRDREGWVVAELTGSGSSNGHGNGGDTAMEWSLERALGGSGALTRSGCGTKRLSDRGNGSLGESLCATPATWQGVWRGPSSPCARRLDIKVYPHHMLPYAVSYFTGAQAFNRALRYYANTPPPHVRDTLIPALAPGANALLLSDKGITPAYVDPAPGPGQPRATRKERRQPLGPPLQGIACETELFRALGLAYVPPHMREMLV